MSIYNWHSIINPRNISLQFHSGRTLANHTAYVGLIPNRRTRSTTMVKQCRPVMLTCWSLARLPNKKTKGWQFLLSIRIKFLLKPKRWKAGIKSSFRSQLIWSSFSCIFISIIDQYPIASNNGRKIWRFFNPCRVWRNRKQITIIVFIYF